MSDEQPETVSIEDAVKEMQSQYAALKESFEQSTKEKDDIISELRKTNEELKRAVVRTAFSPAPPEEKEEPTAEELYAQRIGAILDKSKKLTR